MSMEKTMELLRKSVVVCREGANLISMYQSFDDLTMVQNHRDYIDCFFDDALSEHKISEPVRDLWGYRNATAYTKRCNELFHVEQS